MGALADRTKTKWGQFRPYLLWLALPFGILSVLAFTTPDLSDTNKVIYAFVTYTLLMMVYTAINIPYCSLGGVLTADPRVCFRSNLSFYFCNVKWCTRCCVHYAIS